MVLKHLFFILFFAGLTSCGTDSSSNNNDALPIETPAEKGASLYTVNCTSCHGEDGKMGGSGAKDLSKSQLSDKQIKKILQKGKNAMPPMSAILENEENMDYVIQHIKTLRK
jgi:mono/diheme cytochrome c family protein